MAHPADNRWCSPVIFRSVWFLVALCLVGYSVKTQLSWHSSGRASCPWCECDCSSKSTLPLPVGEFFDPVFINLCYVPVLVQVQTKNYKLVICITVTGGLLNSQAFLKVLCNYIILRVIPEN